MQNLHRWSEEYVITSTEVSHCLSDDAQRLTSSISTKKLEADIVYLSYDSQESSIFDLRS